MEIKKGIKFEDGKVKASLSAGYDGDNDGQASVSADLEIQLDAHEMIGEMLKQDGDKLLDILGKLGVKL